MNLNVEKAYKDWVDDFTGSPLPLCNGPFDLYRTCSNLRSFHPLRSSILTKGAWGSRRLLRGYVW